MHVVGAARRQRQELCAQKFAVIEGEQEIRPGSGHARQERRRIGIGGRGHFQAVPARMALHAVEPDQLARRILVGHHQRHLDALPQQHPQAPYAHVVVGEDDRARHEDSGCCSSTASTMKRGRRRTSS